MIQTDFSDRIPEVKRQSSLVRKLGSVNRITVFFIAIVSGIAFAVFFYLIMTAQHQQPTRASDAGYRVLLDDFGACAEGTAVVADEIRKLSKSSAAQSKRIGEELRNVQQSISSVVGASTELSSAFKSVSDELNITNRFVPYIKQAMQEQNEGSKRTDASLRVVNGNTTSVRDASRETAAGNKSIFSEIGKLQNNAAGMKEGMDETAIGARQINEAGTALENISLRMKDAIQKIGSQIDRFEL